MGKSKRSLSVAVILGFYNGNKYILDQLESIISQTHKNISVFIFDDNSSEKIIKKEIYSKQKYPNQISIITRKTNLGYAKNFLYGLKELKNNFDYYAFSDQDDIWDNNKIEQALIHLNHKDNSKANLYCSRTNYYNYDLSRKIGSSKIFNRPPTFRNAILQNIAGGNTIVLNNKAKEIISKTIKCKEYVSHDWWCYQIISASEGAIIFNKTTFVKYRQHNKNIIGRNNSLKEKSKRLFLFFSGKYKDWCEINMNNLKLNKDIFSKNNLRVLNYFLSARKSNHFIKKIKNYKKSGVYRQSKIENIIFLIGLLLNKI